MPEIKDTLEPLEHDFTVPMEAMNLIKFIENGLIFLMNSLLAIVKKMN